MIKNKGTILIITFLIMGILLLLGSYFLLFTTTESKISQNQKIASQTYYLAEAGINEAIWKLKNDNTISDGDFAWKDDFVDPDKNPDLDGDYWTATFSRSFDDGSYTVTIQNSTPGRGEIVSTSTFPLSEGKTAQRIVKTTVFKALASPVGDNAVFSGGSSENIDIKFSRIKIDKGNLFSNHNLAIKWLSTVEVYDNPDTFDDPETPGIIEKLEGKVLAVGNYSKSADSNIVAEAICAKNNCSENCPGYPPTDTGCPPDSLSIPLVDFDSSSSDSFKNRAQTAQDLGQCEVLCNGVLCDTRCVYSASEFEDLLWLVGEGGILTINNEITYVTGNIEIKGGRHLTVNGALIADDNIKIGKKYSWKQDEGFSQIKVNQTTSETPSGLLTKRKIDFGLYSTFPADPDITGIIYANDEVSLVSMPTNAFDVIGGIIARKLSLISVWQWLNITLDNDIILYGLGYKIDGQIIEPAFSPIITIDHWEESY